MRLRGTILLTCVVAVASANADPIAACRTAYAGNSAAHIKCLEDALRAAGAASTPTPTPTPVQATPAATAAPVAVAPPPAGLGAEQVMTRQSSADAASEQAAVRIVSVRYTASGLGYFSMADGQVWVETEAAPMRVHLEPGREYGARIERGKVGGYRLYVEGVSWMYKVKRLQ
jgi:hypothetical protein